MESTTVKPNQNNVAAYSSTLLKATGVGKTMGKLIPVYLIIFAILFIAAVVFIISGFIRVRTINDRFDDTFERIQNSR